MAGESDSAAMFDALDRLHILERDRAESASRIRALEKDVEFLTGRLAEEKEYSKSHGASVKSLQEWQRKVQDEALERQVRDQASREAADAAKKEAGVAKATANEAGDRADLAGSRAQRASWIGIVTLALTLALTLTQHFTGQAPQPTSSEPAAETTIEGGE